jgi:hypothetical protein
MAGDLVIAKADALHVDASDVVRAFSDEAMVAGTVVRRYASGPVNELNVDTYNCEPANASTLADSAATGITVNTAEVAGWAAGAGSPSVTVNNCHKLHENTHPVNERAANLGDATHGCNVRDKYAGKARYDTTNSQPLWADGSGTTDPWVDATGTTQITPS